MSGQRAAEVPPWLSPTARRRVTEVASRTAALPPTAVAGEIERLAAESGRIHDDWCLNLNPATNRMNPRAEALLAARLGSRPSLGHPGEKYETGLEAIEQIEVAAAELACRVFRCRFAEVRVPSGSIANLYAFLATCRPGDTIIAPPASIGGHITHHDAGAAGLAGLRVIPAPVDAERYTVDVAALRELAREVRPALITLGGSLNLFPHPVAAVREVADEVGAALLFDAAHVCGLVAGGRWADPLAEGAHLMTMSTYKSLGGPPAGLVLTDDADLAERIDAIAHPGLTANFDVAKTAALAVTLADWVQCGSSYAEAMLETAAALAEQLQRRGIPVFGGDTTSHQLAVVAGGFGGGQRAAGRLREANLLASGIGLPAEPVPGDVNGLRLGTPELARLGMRAGDMASVAGFVARALDRTTDVGPLAEEVTAWRAPFTTVHFTAA